MSMAHMGGPNAMTNGGMTQMANVEVERHIRQNNERLRCIQRQLQSPELFEKAAKELLEWCSDQRAFQKSFEQSLMSCLTVISDVATKPGFNLSLGYRLLAVCSSNREKFSPKSSSLLHHWCEELGRLLLLHLQNNNRPNEGMKPMPNPSSGPHNHMNMNYGPGGPIGPRMAYSESPVWNHGGPGPSNRPMPGQMPQRPQHHSVSVTTTVWGVTNTTQTPPIRGQSHPPINQYPVGPGPGPHPRPHSQNPAYHMNSYGHQKQGSYSGSGPYQRPEFSGMGAPHRGMPAPGYGPNNVPHQGHHIVPETGDYPPPAAAAAAAAVAAAAATATATATATLMVNDQQQQQQHQQNDIYDQMGPHRGNVMHPMDPSGNNVAPGPMIREPGPHSRSMGPGNGRGPIRPNMMNQYGQPGKMMSPGPHPMNPTHHPAISPVGGPNHGPGAYNSMNQQYRPPYRSHSASYGPTSPYDAVSTSQFKSPPLTGHPNSHSGFSPRGPTPSSHTPGPLLTVTPDLYPSVSSAGVSSQYYPTSQSTPNSAGPHSTPGPMGYNPQRPPFGSQYGPVFRGPHQHQPPNPMPGNPTPPITPGSAHNVPPYPGPDVKPPLHTLDVKPIIPNPAGLPPLEDPMSNPNMPPTNNDEMRMTFPVRDGVVLESFRLEHNRSVSTHAFHLRPPAYQTLMWRSDLELQFKCYHHDDKMQYTNWPHSVQVTVNGTKMHIPRNPVCKPLYLREVCQPGRNTIEISVSTCCCSHYFVLQLVHRPSVRSVLMGLLQKRMLPAAHCVTKIKRYFSNGMINGTKGMLGSPMGNGTNPIEETNSTVVSLRCPITYTRINLPARGNECKHIQCFDLEAYLQLNSDKRTWRCPICKKSALLEGLEVDQYIWGILKQSHSDDMEVIIDSRCNWKPVTVKREAFNGDDDGPPSKRFRSTGMSPATMLNHLPSPGSYVPQMTPIPPSRLTMTPDMPASASGFPQNSGGCGFHNNTNGMMGGNRNMTTTPGPMINGMGHVMGLSNALSPNNAMGMPNMNNGVTLQRMNPMQQENIAADDMVTIKKYVNPARANNLNRTGNTSSPNRPVGGHPTQPNTLMRSSSNTHLPQLSGSFQQQSGPTPDHRLRNTMSAPSNAAPGTPGNSTTTSVDLLSPQSNSNNANNINATPNPTNVSPDTLGSSNLNFDTTAVNGTGIGDHDDKIPSLDILPDNGIDFMDLPYLGPDDDDIFSMFENAN